MSVTDLGSHEREFERTPPHDVAAEQSVIGGMLISPTAIAEVVEILRSSDFYRPAHQILFDTILDLYGRGEPADAVTVVAELTKRGDINRVGGAPYLHTLMATVPTAANAGYYAKIVRERAVLRRLVEVGTRIVQLGYASDGADADEVLDRAQAEVFAIAEKRTGEDYLPLSEIMPGALDEIEAIGSRGGQMTGVPTGFSDLDALTNGLHPGQMIIVAARPAIGKAVSVDTPLPTPNGWTTMGEVKVGDHLLGADGRPTRVVAATGVMTGRPCYEVEFSDGEVIIADARHQWRTTALDDRPGAWSPLGNSGTGGSACFLPGAPSPLLFGGMHVRPRPSGVSYRAVTEGAVAAVATGRPGGVGVAGPRMTCERPDRAAPQTARLRRTRIGHRSVHREALGTPAAGRSAHPGGPAAEVAVTSIRTTEEIARTLRRDGRPNHAVAVASPFELPAVRLPVDPYLLGARLGAGDDGQGAVTGFGSEPPEESTVTGRSIVRCSRPGRHEPPGLTERLRELGVLDDAHIPPIYLRASEQQRRALLAGLLDTAGSVSENGQVQFVTTNPRLAEGLGELVLSLGHRATMCTERAGGESEETSTRYRVGFTPTETVFRSPDKAARHKRVVHPETRVRHIVDVRPIPSVPVRCVQVDNADHMYLAGRSCIPTHNSTLALDFARAASIRHGLTSAFFSLEMGRNEITMRLLSAEARVALHAMRSGTMQDEDWTRLARRMSEVAEAPLFIDDSPNMSMMEIRAKCRRLKQQHDLRLVIIDYLQLMTSNKRVESRQVEVSEFSRSLKLLAKELQVPVIALSQLNRGPEQRTDKKPMVSDLRESGCLTADIRLLRADTGTEITLGELLAKGARDIPVWSLDDRLKLVPRTLTHAFPSGTKETFRVRLASGREVHATANHPFLTYDGWTPLEELRVGSRIAALRHVPPPLQLRSMNDDEVVMLAHMIGDGSLIERQCVRYASQDEDCLAAVGEAARHFGVTAVRDDHAAARVTTLRLPAPHRLTHGRRNPIAEWADGFGLYGRRSHEKFVPAPVFQLPKKQVALFVRHLWATDGCVFWDEPRSLCRLYYASTSRRLVDDVSLLLLRFGITSRIKTVHKPGYRPLHRLHVYGAENQLAFFDAIGVHGRRGTVAAIAARELRKKHANTNVDTVPREVWTDVRRVLKDKQMSHREFAAAMDTEFCGGALWKRSPSRPRLRRVASVLDSAELEMVATNDVFWDTVVSIESLGERPVYDATVMGTHNFVANGINLKNSIEQDADMVILLHREDAYEKESPRAGEADLIVAKHRNGPTATVTVAFQGHYSRFVDMAQ